MELVLSQIQAWNEGNLSKLTEYYSNTIEVYKQPENKLMFSSKEDVIKHIKSDFEKGTVQKVTVINKIEVPPFVVLIEEKKLEHGPKRALITYYVENGKIQKMWIGPSN